MTQTSGATDAARRFAEASRALREQLRHDPHRPLYHFLPPRNWMNDPNGVIQFGGEYHLFYQHNPFGPAWGNIHWGHAVSPDLVHWTDRPVALAPTPGTADEGGCWSGCAVDHDGALTLVYTGVRGPRHEQQLICLATSDDLLTWRPHPANPVIPGRPPGLDLVQYRDPCVWREEDTWYLVVGSGLIGRGGTALLYRSPDLVNWEYLHPLCVGDRRRTEPVWTGTMWECPDFFPLGGKHVLVVSAWDRQPLHSVYAVGRYEGYRFTAESERVLDAGRWYAPQSFEDERGRRISWGWLREGRHQAAQEAAGWSGVMGLPRVVTLRQDGDLGFAPVEEIERLRGEHRRVTGVAIVPGARGLLPGLAGDCLELAAELEPGDAATVGLVVRRSPDGAEQTRVLYDRAAGRLRVDRSQSTLDPASDAASPAARCPLGEGEALRLRVFLDHSVLEVFANERVCLSERIYPSRADSLGLDLVAEGGEARLRALDVWRMHAIWPHGGEQR